MKKDYELFIYYFKQQTELLNENKTITIQLTFNKQYNFFYYNIIGLYNNMDKDIIFSLMDLTELNKIMKYLLNNNYLLDLDFQY